MREQFYDRLVQLVSEKCIQKDELLAKYTTFRIGGPADYVVTIRNEQILSQVIQLCKEFDIPYYMIGKGSNLLVSDAGYRGAILRMSNESGIHKLSKEDELGQRLLQEYHLNPETTGIYRACAGVSLIAFALQVCRDGYTGFEFASGIPGSLGGAVTMNAGAYGGEIEQVLLQATVVMQDGTIRVYQKDELQMGYRKCLIQENGSFVTEAIFAFQQGNPEEIMAKVKSLSEMRVQKQPLEYPSAGSTFKRPVGYFAGKLIMDAGLRGYQVGDAQVSEKHCGFVINKGHATAKNVLDLIGDVQRKVKEQFHVDLETEVKMLGEF